MKKFAMIILSIVCLLTNMPVLVAQSKESKKPVLAVYSFFGDGVSRETGEALATELLTKQASKILNQSFRILLRTDTVIKTIGRVEELLTEQDIIRDAEQAGAQYVLTGYVTQFQKSKLMIVMIQKIRTPDTPQLFAGFYTIYNDISEISEFSPDAAALFREKMNSPGNAKKNLRIVPFHIAPSITGMGEKDASTLALMLTIEIANTKEYTVIPYIDEIQGAVRTEEEKGGGDYREEN